MAHNAKVITISNFKGGSGKTTGTAGLSYVLAKAGHKVLVIDFDPQADITFYLMPQYDPEQEDRTFFDAIQDGDLLPVIRKAHRDHPLFLLPAALDLTGMSDYTYKRYPRDLNSRNRILGELIDPLREKFDYIFIDVPPTLSFATNNAFAASDYIIISLQTQGSSFRATKKIIPEIRHLVDTLGIELKILGVMAIIHSRMASLDVRVLEHAADLFGNVMFDTIIRSRERIKAWGEHGITDNPNDRWDREALEQFERLAAELVHRAERLEVKPSV